MNEGYVAFQTPNVVWDSTIAIYLFLLGISAGSTLLAVLYKRTHKPANPSESWIIRSAAVLAPGAIIVGLTLLIFHLARPWTFWYLMFNYQFNSVMSMGVMLFQLFMATLFLWLAIIFKAWIGSFKFVPRFVINLIGFAEKFSNLIELVLMFFAVALGAYTGFLLSALISYPMLNNPILPILFLVSGTSSGVAALFISILVVGKVSGHGEESKFLHKFEIPTLLIEGLLLFAFFTGLYFGGGQKTLAAMNALSGFWGSVFWIGVVAIGLIFQLVATQMASHELRHNKAFIITLSIADLIGVLCLRYFILYAGQATIA